MDVCLVRSAKALCLLLAIMANWTVADNGGEIESSEPLSIDLISFYDDATNTSYKGPLTTQYLVLNERIMKEANIQYNLEMATIYEARAIFSRGNADVHFPGICEVNRQRKVVYSEPVVNFDRYLVAMKGQPVFQNIEAMRGKTLGLVHRFIYQLPSDEQLAKMDIKVYRAQSIAASVRMLLNGRVDVILAPLEALGNIKQRLGLNRQFSIPQEPFSSNPLCYVAHDNDRGQQIVSRLNQALNQLRSEGALANLVPAGTRPVMP